MTIYGDNTAIAPFARKRDLSLTTRHDRWLNEEEAAQSSRPIAEEDGLIRRPKRYNTTRQAAMTRLKTADAERGWDIDIE